MANNNNLRRQRHTTKHGDSHSHTHHPQTPQSPSSQPPCAFSVTFNVDTSLPQPPNPHHQQKRPRRPSLHPRFHPSFLPALHHLSSPLAPLVSITTGLPHPSFPRTLLSYHLLSSSQLDDLARHYHQIWPPVPETFGYPIRVRPWVGTGREMEVDVETKRRRLGRFVGLRGCESPVGVEGRWWGEGGGDGKSEREMEGGSECQDRFENEEEMLDRMEWEWEDSLRRARSEDPEEALRRKAGGV